MLLIVFGLIPFNRDCLGFGILSHMLPSSSPTDGGEPEQARAPRTLFAKYVVFLDCLILLKLLFLWLYGIIVLTCLVSATVSYKVLCNEVCVDCGCSRVTFWARRPPGVTSGPSYCGVSVRGGLSHARCCEVKWCITFSYTFWFQWSWLLHAVCCMCAVSSFPLSTFHCSSHRCSR